MVTFLKEKDMDSRERLPSSEERDPEVCDAMVHLLARIGDKWSLMVVSTLGAGALRFNELRRRTGDISQKVLSSTLKVLERDGIISRTVTLTAPPQVEYELTDLGHELLVPVWALTEWTRKNAPRIVAARTAYDTRTNSLAG
jgi:DNA-binding HxlR family transcriptional regulator